ncbi:MAG: hypothetical protein ACJAW4_002990 [Paracoccaceae bacterium]|jgi:hypothetical protein
MTISTPSSLSAKATTTIRDADRLRARPVWGVHEGVAAHAEKRQKIPLATPRRAA